MLKWLVAPVESCRFVVQRSPKGRLGSVLDVRSRLHRMRRRLDHIYQFSQLTSSLTHDQPGLEFQTFESYGMPKAHAQTV